MRPTVTRRWARVGAGARSAAGFVMPAIGAVVMAYGFALAGAGTGLISSPATVLDEYFDGDGPRESLAERGRALFQTDFTPEEGLGPLFNARSCLSCHSAPVSGGSGPDGLGTVLRIGTLRGGVFDSMVGRGGPIARSHSLRELGYSCAPAAGAPAAANMTSVRTAPPLFGLGLVNAIPDAAILEGAVPRGDGILGRPAMTRDDDGTLHAGRFGWKAETPTLEQFVAEAFRNELGITNPRAPVDLTPPSTAPTSECATGSAGTEDDGTTAQAVTAYIAVLEPPARSPAAGMEAGAELFAQHSQASPARANGASRPLRPDRDTVREAEARGEGGGGAAAAGHLDHCVSAGVGDVEVAGRVKLQLVRVA